MLTIQVKVNQAPPTEWLTSGETYIAKQARPGQDFRFVRANGAATYVREHIYLRAVKDGSFTVSLIK